MLYICNKFPFINSNIILQFQSSNLMNIINLTASYVFKDLIYIYIKKFLKRFVEL